MDIRSKADREDHIALLLVQLQKDMVVVTAANMVAIAGLRSLKGINTIIGSKARINDLEETTSGALKQIAVGCEDILMLTKNKKCTHDAERIFTTNETRFSKWDNQKAIGISIINQITPPSKLKSKARTQNRVKELLLVEIN